jgi:hypothetical protein
MKHLLVLSILPCLLVLTPGRGPAQINLEARFALHAKDHFVATKAIQLCPDPTDPTVPNYSPNWDGVDCYSYTVRRPANEYPGPHVFLLVVRASSGGIWGASCGVTYDPNTGPGNGIDPRYVTWAGCSDGLEFLSDGGHGNFPAPDGGIRITWVTCQNQIFGRVGVHAVLGAFYVYAYSEDVLKITPNYNVPPGPEMAVESCSGQQQNLAEFYSPSFWPYLGGAVHFGGDGSRSYNPCLEVPVKGTTWGQLKTLYSLEDGN